MSYTNAKEEFIEHIKEREVICAKVTMGGYWNENPTTYLLPRFYVKKEWDAFIASLDFKYDSGYGGQELFGTIWYADGTWSSRGEYDGSEWWEHNELPEIPEELK